MAGFFKAVALDLDGTIAHGGSLSDAALCAVEETRAAGIAVILVTGRILDELHAEFPGLADHFDAVVAENGGVLVLDRVARALSETVDDALAGALEARGIHVRRGHVLLACSAGDTEAVLAEVARLGLDCQLLRNRGELMVLPSGVSKGTGLVAALDEFELSTHNTLAIGDAENDLALLQAAEFGVAVSNAVPSLKHHADLVLDEEDGTAVAGVLRGPLLRGVEPVRVPRHHHTIGWFTDGQQVRIPGAQANILICGKSGAGKSHLAGLLVEQWVDHGYSVLVVDPEGDHAGLGRLRNMVVLGTGRKLPHPHEIATMLRTQRFSVVLDISAMEPGERAEYLRSVAAVVEAERAVSGLPHWIVIDEAHQSLGDAGVATEFFRPGDLGHCLITYLPEQLSSTAGAAIDITLRVTRAPVRGVCPRGIATYRDTGGPEREFTVADRRTPQRRHLHKYTTEPLPPHRWFRFRDGAGAGAEVRTAADLTEFAHAVSVVDNAVIDFHLSRGDFSRWVIGTLQDRDLGAALAAVERDLLAGRAEAVERARDRVLAEIGSRYGESPPGPA